MLRAIRKLYFPPFTLPSDRPQGLNAIQMKGEKQIFGQMENTLYCRYDAGRKAGCIITEGTEKHVFDLVTTLTLGES